MKIISDNGNGGVAVTHPAPNRLAELMKTLTKPKAMIQIAKESNILEYEIVADSVVSSDRTFRDAWEKNLKKVEVNMPKARVIHMDRIRIERDKELEKLDIVSLKNLEAGLDNTTVSSDKQTLRDIPTTFDLEQFITPQALKTAWPTGLPR